MLCVSVYCEVPKKSLSMRDCDLALLNLPANSCSGESRRRSPLLGHCVTESIPAVMIPNTKSMAMRSWRILLHAPFLSLCNLIPLCLSLRDNGVWAVFSARVHSQQQPTGHKPCFLGELLNSRSYVDKERSTGASAEVYKHRARHPKIKIKLSNYHIISAMLDCK